MNRLAALRRRFIVVVMATITVMLLFIMLIIIAGNVQHYKNVAFESLHSLINFTNLSTPSLPTILAPSAFRMPTAPTISR